MGGICGYVGDGDAGRLDAMIERISHRGSAGRSSAALRGAGLGQLWGEDRPHASAEGVSRDGRVRCVLGGALFNGEELRARAGLDVAGGPFDDATIIAELFAKEGDAAVQHLDGAFGLAVHDDDGVLLVRDAIGERPLYYAAIDERTSAFASEIKALLTYDQLEVRPNLGSLSALLVYSFIPGPDTMFQGVHELEPGCCVRLRPGQPLEPSRAWWRLRETIDPDYEDAAGAARVAELCRDAVERRLPKSGRIAAFLSGGVDSSAAVALLAERGLDPICISVGFGFGQPNELAYARLVADHCGVEHRIIDVEPESFLDLLPRIMWNLDDPLCDCITVPNYIMAREAAAESRVVFNGEGGDPLFGGPKNKFMILGEWYKPYGGYDRHHAYLASYHKFYEHYEALLTPEFVEETGGKPELVKFVAPYLDDPDMGSFLNRLMQLNIKLKGGHNILVKVDKMLSAHGVRPASPLFDRRLAEYSMSLPPAAKRRGDVEKFAFKKAIDSLLPHPVVYRKKEGMGVPLNHWFRRTALGPFAADILRSTKARQRGYFRQEFVDSLLDDKPMPHALGRDRTGEMLWMLLAVELWHRVFVDGEASP